MNYKEIQEDYIKKYNIDHQPDSKCWSRTHAHIKSRRVCKHKIKNSYASLYTLLHEIGHIENNKLNMHRYVKEYYAVMWTNKQLKELNLPIKRSKNQNYKNYVRMTLARGVRRGLINIDREIGKWCGFFR